MRYFSVRSVTTILEDIVMKPLGALQKLQEGSEEQKTGAAQKKDSAEGLKQDPQEAKSAEME